MLSLKHINVGAAARKRLQFLPNLDKQTILQEMLEYLQTFCSEFKDRFSAADLQLYKSAACLDPKNVLSAEYKDNNPFEINSLIDKFKILTNFFDDDLNASIVDGWNSILSHKDSIEKLPNSPYKIADERTPIDVFWVQLLHYQDYFGKYPFEDIAQFALTVCCTPNSNADPERLWSDENNIMTRNRNSLHIKSINGLILSKNCIRLQKGLSRKDRKKYHTFQPTKTMMQLKEYGDIYKPSSDEQDEVLRNLEENIYYTDDEEVYDCESE